MSATVAEGLARAEGRDSPCTTGKCHRGFLKPHQSVGIVSALAANGGWYLSPFQLQFSNWPFLGVKSGQVVKVLHRTPENSVLFAEKYGLNSACHLAVL